MIAPPCAPIGLIERAYADARHALSLACPDCGSPQLLPTEAADPAVVLVVGRRAWLAYDREDMERIADAYGYGAVVGIFAHELGHLIDLQESGDTDELSADGWSGCALAIAGLGIEPIDLFLTVEAQTTGTTHPPPDMRVEAIKDGHAACARLWKD